MTKAINKRKSLFGPYSFRWIEFMTIMTGSMAAGQQRATGAVTDNSHLGTPQGRERDTGNGPSLLKLKACPFSEFFPIRSTSWGQVFKHEPMMPNLI